MCAVWWTQTQYGAEPLLWDQCDDAGLWESIPASQCRRSVSRQAAASNDFSKVCGFEQRVLQIYCFVLQNSDFVTLLETSTADPDVSGWTVREFRTITHCGISLGKIQMNRNQVPISDSHGNTVCIPEIRHVECVSFLFSTVHQHLSVINVKNISWQYLIVLYTLFCSFFPAPASFCVVLHEDSVTQRSLSSLQLLHK